MTCAWWQITKKFFESNDLEISDETEEQIFVHAGINEDNDDLGHGRWKTETSDYEWKGKFPPTSGSFYKTLSLDMYTLIEWRIISII